MNNFPRGVEVISGLIIRNQEGKIFLATGKKWHDMWIVVGGHVEPGETIMECAKREGEEETGLELEGVGVVNWGEMIASPNFHRPAHFVYFDCLFDAKSEKVTLNDELTEYKWVTPEEALKMNCNPSTHEAIRAYVKYVSISHAENNG